MSETRKCDICDQTTTPSQNAVYFCKEDGQKFCLSCATTHQNIATTARHHLECLLPSGTHVPCLHRNQQSFYCEKHAEACCTECKISGHEDCLHFVKTITDFLDEENNSKACGIELLRNLDTAKKEVKKMHKKSEKTELEWENKLQSELSLMNKAKEELEQKIKTKANYLKEHLKKRREDLTKKENAIHKAYIEIKQDLESLENEKLTHTEKVRQILHLKQVLKQHKSLMNLDLEETQMAFLKTVEHDFEANHNVSESLAKFLDSIESLTTTSYMFHENGQELGADNAEDVLDRDITNVKERIRTQSEMIIRTKEEVKTRPKSASESTSSGDQPQSKKKLGELKQRKTIEEYESLVPKNEKEPIQSIPIQSQCQMNIKVLDDTGPSGITGITKLDDGYLLMADYENTKLKLFAPCGDFKGQLKCEHKPRDMAYIEKNRALVNFPIAKKIHFVTVDTETETNKRSITLGDKIEVFAKCCGIYVHNNKIYVATQAPNEILIMSMEGVTEKKVGGESIFERATYISVDPDSSLIYISDPNRKLVIGMNEEKEIRFTYKVERPHGIVCAYDGIFVADWHWEDGSIHFVSKDGIMERILKVNNCYCPQKLVYYKNQNTLLVTQWQNDTLTTVYLGENSAIS